MFGFFFVVGVGIMYYCLNQYTYQIKKNWVYCLYVRNIIGNFFLQKKTKKKVWILLYLGYVYWG